MHLETKRIVRKTAITYIITRRQNHIFKGYARDLRLGDVSGPDGAEPPRRLEAPRPLRSKPRTVHVILDYRSLSYIVHYSSFSHSLQHNASSSLITFKLQSAVLKYTHKSFV